MPPLTLLLILLYLAMKWGRSSKRFFRGKYKSGVDYSVAIITKISVQKRNKSRYNLFLDRGKGEEYACSIDEDLLIKHRLKKGLEIVEEDLINLIDEDEQKKTYYLAIHFLSYRMRSISEMRAYLIRKEREERHIEAVIQQLIDEKLLNDQAFAEAYIQTKKKTVMKGPQRLKQELMEKGIKSSIIEETIEQFSISEQVDQLSKWLERQKGRNHKRSNKAFLDKLVIQLQRKGFSLEIIKEALNDVQLTKEKDDEWEAICYQGEKILTKYAKKYDGWELWQRVKQSLYQKGFSLELIEQFLSHAKSTES